MILQFSRLKWMVLLAIAALVSASSGKAEQHTNGWKKIVFSAPKNAQINSNLTSVTHSPLSSLQNKLRLYQDSSPVASFDNPSLMAAPPMAAPIRTVQKSPDDNRGWEFMTPAEILGISSDQIFKTQKRNADPETASLTPFERAFETRSSSAKFQAAPFDRSPAPNFWRDKSAQASGFMSGSMNDSLKDMQSGLFSPNTSRDSENRNPQSFWGNTFGMPAPAPNQNPALAQQQDMKQFRELLNRSSALATAATPAPTAPSDLGSTEPLPNPVGASFTPLTSGIRKPAGLEPLPTITRQPSPAVAPPAWAPQSPPWLSPTPQPFAIPQRKF